MATVAGSRRAEPQFISKGDTAAPLAGAPEGEWMVAARLAGGTGIRFQRSLRGTPNPVDVDAFLRIAVTALNAASAVSAKTAPGRFEEQQHAGSAVS